MNMIHVVNIKCGGCEKKITKSLHKEGLSNVKINIEHQTVSFDGDINKGREVLGKLGYPEAGTPEAESVMKKAHSYLSCAVGRMG